MMSKGQTEERMMSKGRICDLQRVSGIGFKR